MRLAAVTEFEHLCHFRTHHRPAAQQKSTISGFSAMVGGTLRPVWSASACMLTLTLPPSASAL